MKYRDITLTMIVVCLIALIIAQSKAFMLPSTIAYGSMGAMVQQPICKGIAVVFIEKK